MSEPTVVLVEKNATTKVVARLYGAVSAERLEAERASLKHRLNQLSPLPPKKQKTVERDEYEDLYRSYADWVN